MSGPEPAVSVAIRAHRERWLGEAIDSVLDGSFSDLELIVYDDRGGLEGAATRRGDPRVRYVRAGGDGGPAGRFAAAAGLCRGRYVAMLDDDDRWEPAFLERLLQALEADPGAGIAFCKVAYLAGGGVEVPADGRSGGRRPEVAREVTAFRTFIPPSTMLIRREAWLGVAARGPMPPEIAPDAYLHVHAAALGWGHVLVDARLALRRWHREQVSRSGMPLARMAVATWTELGTGDPELERLRLEVLSRKRIKLAAHLLAAGDRKGARDQLRLAAGASGGRERLARAAVSACCAAGPAGRVAARAALALERSRPFAQPGVR